MDNSSPDPDGLTGVRWMWIYSLPHRLSSSSWCSSIRFDVALDCFVRLLEQMVRKENSKKKRRKCYKRNKTPQGYNVSKSLTMKNAGRCILYNILLFRQIFLSFSLSWKIIFIQWDLYWLQLHIGWENVTQSIFRKMSTNVGNTLCSDFRTVRLQFQSDSSPLSNKALLFRPAVIENSHLYRRVVRGFIQLQ